MALDKLEGASEAGADATSDGALGMAFDAETNAELASEENAECAGTEDGAAENEDTERDALLGTGGAGALEGSTGAGAGTPRTTECVGTLAEEEGRADAKGDVGMDALLCTDGIAATALDDTTGSGDGTPRTTECVGALADEEGRAGTKDGTTRDEVAMLFGAETETEVAADDGGMSTAGEDGAFADERTGALLNTEGADERMGALLNTDGIDWLTTTEGVRERDSGPTGVGRAIETEAGGRDGTMEVLTPTTGVLLAEAEAREGAEGAGAAEGISIAELWTF